MDASEPVCTNVMPFSLEFVVGDNNYDLNTSMLDSTSDYEFTVNLIVESG